MPIVGASETRDNPAEPPTVKTSGAYSNVNPTAIDLFSGCGGLTLGLKRAGFNVLAAVEVDRLAVEAYRLNHKGVIVWRQDIRTLRTSTVMRKLNIQPGQLGLLAGCAPCEGFSSMRTLNGHRSVDDPRNDLLFEFLRFVKGLQPQTVMMENVPALGSDGRFHNFISVVRQLGYSVRFRTVDVSEYGVPQRRKRLVFLASKSGTIRFARRVRRQRTVRETIGALPPAGFSGDDLHDVSENRSKRIQELIACIPKDGGSRLDLGDDKQLDCHRRSNGFKDVYGRMRWDSVASTITGGCVNPSKGRFLHPYENRSITLREAALLQSFPIRYRFPMSRGKFAVAELIGNAFPPEFVRRQAIQIRRHLELYRQSKEVIA